MVDLIVISLEIFVFNFFKSYFYNSSKNCMTLIDIVFLIQRFADKSNKHFRISTHVLVLKSFIIKFLKKIPRLYSEFSYLSLIVVLIFGYLFFLHASFYFFIHNFYDHFLLSAVVDRFFIDDLTM